MRLAPPPANRRAVVDAQATARTLPKAIPLQEHYAVYTTAFNEMLTWPGMRYS